MNSDVAAPLRVTQWFDGGRAVLEIGGEVDVFTAPRLRSALHDTYAKAGDGPMFLALDVEHLAFMDSTGLGLLIAGLKNTKASGGGLVLVNAPEHLRRVLRITGLTQLLPAFEGLDAAFAHLDSARSAV